MARDDMKRKKENSPPLQLLSTAGEQVNLKKKKKKQRPTPLAEQESSDYTTNKRDKKKASFRENEKKKQRKKANGSSEIYDGDDDAKQLGEKDYAGSNSQKDYKKRKNRIITDSRFTAAQFDPRFQRMPKRESKVVIDSRFTRMFSDKNFEPSAAPVDKRGKRKSGQAVNPLLHYYLHQEHQEYEEEEEQALVKEEVSDGLQSEMDVSSEDIEEGSDDKHVEERSIASSRSDEDSSTDDEDIEDDDGETVSSHIWRYLLASHDDTPVTDTETHRLAIVNMDWDHLKAVDLYVVMSSCLPMGGQILSVTIYPSEYGLKCMEIEAVHGPFCLIDDGNEDGEDSSAIDNEKLRKYELNKLRYYYAVAICDSVNTANHIYGTLDGTELLQTSNVFDLRFIPDSMEFKHPPRDEAKVAPASYKVPEFQTRALQQKQVKLTWEEDEPERKKILRRKFNPDQLEELEAYVAPAGDSDEYDSVDENNDEGQNGEDKKGKRAEALQALLLSGNDSDGEKSDEDLEITFNTELEDLSKRILEKDKKSETVWEAVLRKRSEKKKARKRSKHSEDDSSDHYIEDGPTGDFFDEEPSDAETNVAKKGNAPSKKQRKDAAANNNLRDIEKEQEASRAELELLMAEDQEPIRRPKGYNLKRKKGKNKNGKEVSLEDKLPDVDVRNDPRFSALFTSHLYALDPTDPQYKRSAAFARQHAKKQKNAEAEAPPKDPKFNTWEQVHNAVPGTEDVMTTTDLFADRKDDFLSTIRSLKRNVGTLKNQPNAR